MPKLESYHRNLDYSYALGYYPVMEALMHRPASVRRLLLHTSAKPSDTLDALLRLADENDIRIENADRVLARESGKENVFAAAVFEKSTLPLTLEGNHVVLHEPGDMGNLGSILRSALGFGFEDIAVIRPAADPCDPQVIRSSMGAYFSLRVREYEGFDEYRAHFPHHRLYPLMLTASISLEEAAKTAEYPFALIAGNEGRGLPEYFSTLGQALRIPQNNKIDSLNVAVAASIAMYAFVNAGK